MYATRRQQLTSLFCPQDLWINIPGHADDDYIVNLAKLLKATVDPSLFIYYEYANEVWN